MENEDEEDFLEDEEALVDEEKALDDNVNPDEDALTEGEQEPDEDEVDSQQPTAAVEKTLCGASSGKELEKEIVEHGVTISRDRKKVMEIEFRKNEKVPWEFARQFANGVGIIVRQNDKLDFKTTWKHVPDEVKQPIYAELDKWFTIVGWPRNPIVHAKVYDCFYDAYRYYKVLVIMKPNKSEVDNFGATHMTKAGAYINDEAAKKHAEMKNRRDQAKAVEDESVSERDILSETFGECRGYVRGMGRGVVPPQGSKRMRSDNAKIQLQETSENLDKTHEELRAATDVIQAQQQQIQEYADRIQKQDAEIACLKGQNKLMEMMQALMDKLT